MYIWSLALKLFLLLHHYHRTSHFFSPAAVGETGLESPCRITVRFPSVIVMHSLQDVSLKSHTVDPLPSTGKVAAESERQTAGPSSRVTILYLCSSKIRCLFPQVIHPQHATHYCCIITCCKINAALLCLMVPISLSSALSPGKE